MKAVLFICSALLFLAVSELPIGYYTLLRIAVTAGAVIVVFNESKNGFNFWTIAFSLIAILFNPIVPVYLNDKSLWMPVDIICGIIFIIKAFSK